MDDTISSSIAIPAERDQNFDGRGRFIAGNSVGKHGRPPGSRNRLGEAFVADLHNDWKQNGAEVIRRVRAEDPASYLRTVAHVLPKELDVHLSGDPFAGCETADQIISAWIGTIDDAHAARETLETLDIFRGRLIELLADSAEPVTESAAKP
jgi:hypothetical protein